MDDSKGFKLLELFSSAGVRGTNTTVNDREEVISMRYMFEVTSIDSPWPVAVPLDLRDDDTAIAYTRRVFKLLEAVYLKRTPPPELSYASKIVIFFD